MLLEGASPATGAQGGVGYPFYDLSRTPHPVLYHSPHVYSQCRESGKRTGGVPPTEPPTMEKPVPPTGEAKVCEFGPTIRDKDSYPVRF